MRRRRMSWPGGLLLGVIVCRSIGSPMASWFAAAALVSAAIEAVIVAADAVGAAWDRRVLDDWGDTEVWP